MSGFHDTRYKYLFKHKLLVERLMKSFVHESFVDQLDFRSLERLDKTFVTDEFREKESDIIWKLNYQENPLYIYILIEFQSTVDSLMSLRFLRYITEFYQALELDATKEQYPAVFPLLLYNGDERWTAESAIENLIQPTISKRYIPRFSYYPIIINEIPQETLLEIHNAVSAIFYTENTDYEELVNRIDLLISLLGDELPELRVIFANWFSSILEGKTSMDKIEIKDRLGSLQEVREMFTTSVERYGKRMIEQGIGLGIEKGIEKGAYSRSLKDAGNMKKYGIAIETICKVTGLSEETVKNL